MRLGVLTTSGSSSTSSQPLKLARLRRSPQVWGLEDHKVMYQSMIFECCIKPTPGHVLVSTLRMEQAAKLISLARPLVCTTHIMSAIFGSKKVVGQMHQLSFQDTPFQVGHTRSHRTCQMAGHGRDSKWWMRAMEILLFTTLSTTVSSQWMLRALSGPVDFVMQVNSTAMPAAASTLPWWTTLQTLLSTIHTFSIL